MARTPQPKIHVTPRADAHTRFGVRYKREDVDRCHVRQHKCESGVPGMAHEEEQWVHRVDTHLTRGVGWRVASALKKRRTLVIRGGRTLRMHMRIRRWRAYDLTDMR